MSSLILLCYLAAWISSSQLVLCEEADGSVHIEPAFAECCAIDQDHQILSGLEENVAPSFISAPCADACGDCSDSSLAAPLALRCNSSRLLTASLVPHCAPLRVWFSRPAADHCSAVAAQRFGLLPESEAVRVGTSVLLI